MVTFHYAEKVWSARGIRYWPVRRVDRNLCATERGSPKKIYDRPRRCETRYFSCGLEGYPCITDEIPDRLLVAEPLEYNDLELDGHKLVAMNAGRTDTAHSTCLHVPSIGLIVGGDAVYNGIHPYLGETDTQSRLEWISTLDQLEALKPKAVVAGHKVPENDDDPRIIGETRQYLRDFNRLDEATVNSRELYDAMLELYPDRVNPGSLWGAANTAKKQA